jgi:hypothetical protein
MVWIDLVKNYLADFCTKNLENLEKVYDNEVQLRDWEITAKGKENVISANKELFSNFETIKIHILNTSYRDKLVFVEFILELDDTVLNVVDVININDNGKIKSIKAYKG